MKKQKILISLFVIIVLLFALSGIILATEIIENNELNENIVNNQINGITENNEVVVNNQINDATVINQTNEKEESNNQVNEVKDYLTQFQPDAEDGAKIESIRRKVVIVIIAIAIAAIVILVMWKYEF